MGTSLTLLTPQNRCLNVWDGRMGQDRERGRHLYNGGVPWAGCRSGWGPEPRGRSGVSSLASCLLGRKIKKSHKNKEVAGRGREESLPIMPAQEGTSWRLSYPRIPLHRLYSWRVISDSQHPLSTV